MPKIDHTFAAVGNSEPEFGAQLLLSRRSQATATLHIITSKDFDVRLEGDMSGDDANFAEIGDYNQADGYIFNVPITPGCRYRVRCVKGTPRVIFGG